MDWACYSVRAGGVLCRRGRAAASSVATHLATQLLAAVPRPDVLIRCQFNAARIKPRAAVENFFSLCTPTPTSSLRPSNSRSLLPFQATRTRQQLRQELRHRLHPLAQALIPHSRNRAVLLRLRPKHRRKHFTAASSSPGSSTVARYLVEVAVSPWYSHAPSLAL